MGHLGWTDRTKVLDWLYHHPSSVHGDAAVIMARAERETRRRAREGAWREARDLVRPYTAHWEKRWGAQASDDFVANEIFPTLARVLRQSERHVKHGDHVELVGKELTSVLEPDALEAIADWAVEVGEQEHHRVWQEIVQYTRTQARELLRDDPPAAGSQTAQPTNFAAKAARMTRLLEREFDNRSRLSG